MKDSLQTIGAELVRIYNQLCEKQVNFPLTEHEKDSLTSLNTIIKNIDDILDNFLTNE